jgi:hypothetical protein
MSYDKMTRTTMGGVRVNRFDSEQPGISEWRELVRTAYDNTWWSRLSDDSNHYGIIERIGRPLRVKLLYDSHLWKWVLESLGAGKASHIAELLPGWSHTIAAALESLGFSGELLQFDLEFPQSNSTPFAYERIWIKENILHGSKLLSEAQFILGNHILDDLLVCQANPTDNERQFYYSSPGHSRVIWQRLAEDRRLTEWINATADCLANIVNALAPGQTLVLRDYPSTTVTVQGDEVRWRTEREVHKVVFTRLASLDGVTAIRPALTRAPAPPGCCFPGSFLIVTRI